MGFPILIRWHLYIESGPSYVAIAIGFMLACNAVWKFPWVVLLNTWICLSQGRIYSYLRRVSIKNNSVVIDLHIMIWIYFSDLMGKSTQFKTSIPLKWRHNKWHCISKHWHLSCLPKHLFRCISKKISKLRFTGLCMRNLPVTGGFPSQRASNMENVSIRLCYHVKVAKT